MDSVELDRARVLVGLLAVVHAAVAVALVPFGLLSFAYATYPSIDEYTDMSILSPAVQWAILGAWVPVLITPIVAFVVVRRVAEPLKYFWVAPTVGLGATLALHYLPYLFFPEPYTPIGG